MGLSLPHLLLLAFFILILFGGGRVSNLMGDVAKGIKSFKKGMADDEDTARKPETPAAIGKSSETPAQSADQRAGAESGKAV